MSRPLFIVFVVGVVAASVAGAQDPTLAPDAMDRAIREQSDSGFSGVVLVAHHGRVVLRQAYGLGTHDPTETSAFWIGSITKSFTAAIILTLQHEGRLSVQDSLYRFFPDAPPDKRAITIHQLLTHTAGFGDTDVGSGLETRASAVRAILEQPLTYVPGHGYEYGDSDYELLAAVVEVVSGVSWENAIQRQLLDPARLSHTGFWCGPRGRAPGPVPGTDGRRTRCNAKESDWGHRGANGMSATADDLLRWTSELWSAGRDASRFSSITIPHILVRNEKPSQVYYGYGVRLYVRNGQLVEIMHSGRGDDGHTAIVRQLTSGWTIIVLSNAGNHKGTTWSSYVATKLAPRVP